MLGARRRQLPVPAEWHRLRAGPPSAGWLLRTWRERRRLSQLVESPVNVLRLALAPEGMAPQIINLGEWRAHLLGRLRLRAHADTTG